MKSQSHRRATAQNVLLKRFRLFDLELLLPFSPYLDFALFKKEIKVFTKVCTIDSELDLFIAFSGL